MIRSPFHLLVGLSGVCLAAAPVTQAAVLAEYNFGASQSPTQTLAQYQTPTTVASNVSATNLSFGSQTATATNNNASGFYASPGPNYLSVANLLAADDSGFYANFVVTAASGFTFTPTSFTILGGRGGASNVRSWLLFDNVDGLPTSVAATAGSPTVTGATPVGSGAFSAVRGTNAAMDTFTTNFSASVAGLSSFQVRVYFDTQLNGQQKNIDLGRLTLSGDVTAVPEPAIASIGFAAAALLGRRRRQA